MKNNKLKIAVIYRGMYFRIKPIKKSMDFMDVIDNNYKYFLNELGDYDLFYQTLGGIDKSRDGKLKERFPGKIMDFDAKNSNCLDAIINSLKVYDFSQYDFIYNVRFGLVFNKSITEFNIDHTKFNCLYTEPRRFNRNGNIRVSDHIFAFPKSYLPKIQQIDVNDSSVSYGGTKEIRVQDKAHHILHYAKLDLSSDVNYMIEGDHWSGGHPDDIDGMSYIKILRNDTEDK